MTQPPIILSLGQMLVLCLSAMPLLDVKAASPEWTGSPGGEATLPQSGTLEQARALAGAGKHEEALDVYNRMIEAAPGDFDARLARGRTYAWMRRWPAAEADLRAVVTHAPRHADAWSALGDMYLWSNRPVQAAQAYTRWVELEPENPAPLLARGRARLASGDRNAAGEDLSAARVRGADDGQVARLLAPVEPRATNPDVLAARGYQWSARVGASTTSFSPARASWSEQELALRRHFSRGSVALELLQARRFDRRDRAWAVDAYTPLGQKTYANLRFQKGAGEGLFADQAWRVEAFQDRAGGWELSASYDHLDFASGTDLYGLGIGRYVGNAYARYKVQYVAGAHLLGHRGVLRYYFAGNADDYVEVFAGSGQAEELGSGSFGGRVRVANTSVGLAWVKYFHPQWGLRLGASHASDVAGFDERRISAALHSRW